MKLRNREETIEEIERVEAALAKTDSWKLRKDYGKHLKRLYNELRYFDANQRNKYQ